MMARIIHANPWMSGELTEFAVSTMRGLEPTVVCREMQQRYPLLRVVDTFPCDMDGLAELRDTLETVGKAGGRTRWTLTFVSRIQPSAHVYVPTYGADVPHRLTDFLSSGLWRLEAVTQFTDWSGFGDQTEGA